MGCDTWSVICGHVVIARGMSFGNAMILIEALAQKWWQEEGLEIMVRKESNEENK